MGIGENVGEGVGQNTGSSGNDRSRPLPPVITSFTATSSSVTVNWTNPNPYSVDFYGVDITNVSAGTTASVDNITGTSISYTLSSGITSGTQYSAVMTCFDGERESVFSTTEFVVTGSPSSFVPNIANMDFEDGALGDFPVASNGGLGSLFTYGNVYFNNGEKWLEYSNQNVFSGSQSCLLRPVPTEDGTADMGAYYTFSSAGKSEPTEGMGIWWRINIYLPSDFTAQTSTGQLKFMRCYSVTSADGNKGAMEHYFSTSGRYAFRQEFDSGQPNITVTPPENLKWKPGEWQSFEVYNLLSHTRGSGMVRMWRNNLLLYESDQHITLPVDAAKYNKVQLLPFWNGANCNQYPTTCDSLPGMTGNFFVDNVQITDSNNPPVNTDADGNSFIGGSY